MGGQCLGPRAQIAQFDRSSPLRPPAEVSHGVCFFLNRQIRGSDRLVALHSTHGRLGLQFEVDIPVRARLEGSLQLASRVVPRGSSSRTSSITDVHGTVVKEVLAEAGDGSKTSDRVDQVRILFSTSPATSVSRYCRPLWK